MFIQAYLTSLFVLIFRVLQAQRQERADGANSVNQCAQNLDGKYDCNERDSFGNPSSVVERGYAVRLHESMFRQNNFY